MPQVIERGWVSKAPRLRHVAPFDGIRGFGVIGVMAGHALPDATLSFSAIVARDPAKDAAFRAELGQIGRAHV